MAEQSLSVNVEQLSWTRIFPFVHIFKSFTMALHPAKMILALIMVIILFAGGYAMDAISGQDTFDTLVSAKIGAANQLAISTVALDIDGVAGAVYRLVYTIPHRMWDSHKLYISIYSLYALLVWALFGGAISRMAALHAANNQREGIAGALRYAAKRYPWFVVAPLLLPLLAIIIGLVFNTLLFGLPFNVPGLDTLAGLLFVIALAAGAIVTFAFIANALATGLYYPAIAVDDADAFDAIGHGVNYVVGRFFTWLFYNVIALVFGVLTYLLVAAAVVAILKVTSGFISIGEITDRQTAADVLQRLAAYPGYDRLHFVGNSGDMNLATTAAAWLVRVWCGLLFAFLAAYAYSYFICANTWIYLLLRKSADGTEMDDIYTEQ